MKKSTIGALALALMLSVPATNAWAQATDLPAGDPPAGAVTPPNLRPGAFAGAFNFNIGDLTMPGRLFRDGIASDCLGAEAPPGTFGTGPNQYKTFDFVNGGPGTCVTVSLDTGTCGADVHLAAYSGPFNPMDLDQNYLADVGSSVTQPFSFNVAVGAPVVIMAQINPPVTTTCDFSFSSNELVASGAVPTMNGPMLLVLLIGMLGAGVFLSRRRAAGIAV